MKANKRGLTLIELIIAVSIIAVIGIIVIGGIISIFGGGQQSSSEEKARQWAKEMGIEAASVSCTSVDTDGDGYVSCTIAQKSNDGTVQPIPIECAGRFSWNQGCRTPKAVYRGWR